MNRLEKLVEFTRKEITGGVDPKFIHNKQHYKELPSAGGSHYQETKRTQVGRFKHYEVVFATDSYTFPGTTYEQRIILADLAMLLKIKKTEMSLQDKVIYAINEGDLLLFCQCPAHLYWGYKYITTQLGITVPGEKEDRAPDIRNPQRRGIICKHLQLVLSVLSFNASSIAKDVKELINSK